MDHEEQVLSTSAANIQINNQIDDGHYILRKAYAGRGRIMELEYFEDLTLRYGAEAEGRLEKILNRKPESRIYVEVCYYFEKTRITRLDYFSFEFYQSIPKDWKGFKKFMNSYRKNKS